MSITVGDLLAMPGLGLSIVAGSEGLDRPIRWVHTSELVDPTRWLSGGELLLTTGMAVKGSPAHQRSYLSRLIKAGVSGLGFGVGFGFDEVPGPIVRAADRAGFPILEVPYPVPFIAIAEAVSSSLAQERMRDLQMSADVHERLAHLVMEGSGPADVLEEMVAIAPGWAILFGAKREVLAAATSGEAPPPPIEVLGSLPRTILEQGGPTSASAVSPTGTVIALVVTSGKRHEGILVFGKRGRIESRDRIVARHGVTVLGLLLASRRSVIQAERRVAGDVLIEAFDGRLTGPELRRRLELVGFSQDRPVTALVIEHVPTQDGSLEDAAWWIDSVLGNWTEQARTVTVGDGVVAVIEDADPQPVAEKLLAELDPEGTSTRIGVGERLGLEALRRSYLTATLALQAASGDRRVVSPRDLGSYGLLLGAQPRSVLEGFVQSVLGSLIERDRARDSHLVESVRAFVEAGGRWEDGAQRLGVHRHTLRYRINQAQELIHRDLMASEDRMDVWLALKALDLID